ncbi:hypothetical protein TELCIR_01916 [Teladorsagia circumcincta]|uniref:Tc1-like transposase DDE domain-containing protein n=1 Tax=Teladorsagia circumcincta TaxID=45464 RepID=A0A2G9V0N1_TELCI|nr:hypothetical protein TELCIR_01916 [Teladorsagia circumcincta]
MSCWYQIPSKASAIDCEEWQRLLSGRGAQSGFIVQQDSDPQRKSKLLTKWFQENNVPFLPSQSLDFNSIENLWDELEYQVLRAHDEHGKFPQLKISEGNISQEKNGMHIKSMPR